MKYVQLGKTGVRVSELCYGTMSFGGDADEETSKKLYRANRDAGVNFFDCANIYNSGASEKILGRLIAKERDEVVVTSKCFGLPTDGINNWGSSRRNIALSVDASLKRMKTDWLDVYFMHQWDPTTGLEETLRGLEDIVRSGKVRYLGASNYAAWQIAKSLGICNCMGWTPFDLIQPMYNLVKRQVEVELLPLAISENLAVISYNPLGGGLLTGKYGKGGSKKGRLSENDMYAARYGEPWAHDVAVKFVKFAKARKLDPVSLAIAWVASHPGITCPIIGARSVQQLKSCLKSIELKIDREFWLEIADLSRQPALATDRSEEVKR